MVKLCWAAELGAGLIARLPAFPDAPIIELLDVKGQLEGPLTRYRAAVAALERDLSQEVASAELDFEIEAIWRERVAPAVVELEDALTDYGFVRELARAAGASARDLVISGAALAVAVSSVASISASISAAAGVGSRCRGGRSVRNDRKAQSPKRSREGRLLLPSTAEPSYS